MTAYEIRVARSAGIRSYHVPLGDRMTVLDALFRIQSEQDSSLAFRCACRVGMCGTCAMYINRVPRLACKTRISKLDSGVVTIAPLPNLPVIQDLVVLLEPFFKQWRRIKPALRGSASGARLIPPDPETARKRDCITCGICYGRVRGYRDADPLSGPAAINKAFLRVHDLRDGEAKDRLKILNDEWSGVWRCHTQLNCTAVCPRKSISLGPSGASKRTMLA